MPRITPFLWFHTQAEEAAAFYTSVFKNSKVNAVTRYGDAGPMPKGTVMTASFTLDGLDFVALNGGPQYTFDAAVSFVVNCDTQDEIDYYWDRLTADGGLPVQCGWLVDKFGLSWQVVPRQLSRLVAGSDPAAANRVMVALMQMVKLDLGKLEAAAKAA